MPIKMTKNLDKGVAKMFKKFPQARKKLSTRLAHQVELEVFVSESRKGLWKTGRRQEDTNCCRCHRLVLAPNACIQQKHRRRSWEP